MPGVGGRVHRGLAGGSRDRSLDLHPHRRRTHHALCLRLAQSRPRKLLTVVTKSNAQRHGMVMWDEIAAEVAANSPP